MPILATRVFVLRRAPASMHKLIGKITPMKKKRPLFALCCLHLTCLLLPIQSLAQTHPANETTSESPTSISADTLPSPRIGLQLSVRPIKSSQEALAYVGEWLAASGLSALEAGKVQQENPFFLIELLNTREQRKVQNQLLIRKQDGMATLVYPAHGAIQANNNPHTPHNTTHFAISTAKEAQRGLDAWLWINGQTQLHAKAPKDMGGFFIADIVNEKGVKKNQAIVRKSDGFVQLINPILTPSQTENNKK